MEGEAGEEEGGEEEEGEEEEGEEEQGAEEHREGNDGDGAIRITQETPETDVPLNAVGIG